jgi:type VI secretion system ImpM family protein
MPPCLFGRLPERDAFVQRGTHGPAERALQIWIARAIEVEPPPPLRFVFVAERTRLAGVWLASRDARGRVYPLALATRVGPTAGEPWTLCLASYAGYLAAAESCLMLAQRGELEPAWRLARRLAPPETSELAALRREAEAALDGESVRGFVRRTFDRAADSGWRFARAVRSLGAGVAALDLPARSEFELFAWLALLEVQRPAGGAPRAVFFARAGGRALIALEEPDPALLRRLGRPLSAAEMCRGEEAGESERERDRAILRDRSLADLSRALAHGLTALPDAAGADMPPPLGRTACYTPPHAFLEAK